MNNFNTEMEVMKMKNVLKFLLMTFIIISALALAGCTPIGEDNLLQLLWNLFTVA